MHEGRPSSSTTEENIQRAREMVMVKQWWGRLFSAELAHYSLFLLGAHCLRGGYVRTVAASRRLSRSGLKLRSRDHSGASCNHAWAEGRVTNLEICCGERANHLGFTLGALLKWYLCVICNLRLLLKKRNYILLIAIHVELKRSMWLIVCLQSLLCSVTQINI